MVGWGEVKTLSNQFDTMAAPLRHHRFTLDEYEEMLARGILTSDDRVELLAGEIIEKVTIGSRHGACVDKLNRFFSLALGDRAIVRVQGPVALPPDSCPEPDLAILRPCEDFYAGAHPRPDDVLLAIEVSESSLDFDRKVKLPIYAAAGIREARIVEIADATIECHSDPRNGVYAKTRLFRRGETFTAGALPDVRLSVDAAV